jgi:hypothetical protein
VIPVRDDPLFVRDPSPADRDDPVTRKNKWLADHPEGSIGYPWPGEPDMEVAVGGTVITTGYGNYLEELMDAVDRAEAQGCCPVHPRGPS